MKSSSVFVSAALLVASATAQTTSACAAENIVTACLSTENAQLASCGTSDWDCKCNAYVNIITCYNNCPDDTARNSAVGQKELYCSYASAYPSAESTVKITGTATGTAAVTTTAHTTTATTAHTTTSSSSSVFVATAFAAAATGAAADHSLHAGGLFAALVGAVAALV